MGSSSREISFGATVGALHQTLERLERYGTPPLLGTHDWLALAAGSALSVAAVYRAALMWTLAAEEGQRAVAAASKDVAAETDWARKAAEVRRHADAVKSGAYVERRADDDD